ncbi:MAG TPA: hypothetical protein VHH92_04670 [Actinomycetota bacterium]|nr:hypothetical protein [Actinomycetota bacterium]
MTAEAPEREMISRGLAAGAVGAPIAVAGGWLAGGGDGAWSAALAVVIVLANFTLHGLSLAWAGAVSIALLQVVAFGGFVVRMGAIVLALVLLDRTGFFSPAIFGVTAVAGTMALLAHEARLVARGLGGSLRIPPDPAAAAAADELRAREEAPA